MRLGAPTENWQLSWWHFSVGTKQLQTSRFSVSARLPTISLLVSLCTKADDLEATVNDCWRRTTIHHATSVLYTIHAQLCMLPHKLCQFMFHTTIFCHWYFVPLIHYYSQLWRHQDMLSCSQLTSVACPSIGTTIQNEHVHHRRTLCLSQFENRDNTQM